MINYFFLDLVAIFCFENLMNNFIYTTLKTMHMVNLIGEQVSILNACLLQDMGKTFE